MTLLVDDDEDIDFDELRSKFFGFADYLLDNFFLPCKTLYINAYFRSLVVANVY